MYICFLSVPFPWNLSSIRARLFQFTVIHSMLNMEPVKL